MTQAPLFWLQQIEHVLQGATEAPLWGFPPPFPWEKCSEQVATLLMLPDLQISHKRTHFLKPEELSSGLGTNPVKVSIELTPLLGNALWVMPTEDIAKLTQLVLTPQTAMKGFASSQFQEGFYRYLLLNILEQIDELKPFKDLSAKLGATPSMPQEGSLCIDIAIAHPKVTLWGRLICPPSFHQALKQHFSSPPEHLIDLPLAKTVELSLKLDIGQSTLNYSDWKKVQTGDLLILDRCTYDPTLHKGAATCVLEQAPLFRARLKENHLKIVEYAYYHEGEKLMEHDFFKEEDSDPSHHELDDDHSPLEKEEGPSSDGDDHLWSPGPDETGAMEKIVSAHEVPLTLTVEVTRLKINLEKLLQLKPGNLIELPVRPEQGVDLILNGKKVAKGELVKLGETLGVKILQIGN